VVPRDRERDAFASQRSVQVLRSAAFSQQEGKLYVLVAEGAER